MVAWVMALRRDGPGLSGALSRAAKFDDFRVRGERLYVTVRALTQKPLGRGRVPEFLWALEVFGRFPLVVGLVSYPSGSILEYAFLWRVSVDRNLPVFAVCWRLGVPRPKKQ